MRSSGNLKWIERYSTCRWSNRTASHKSSNWIWSIFSSLICRTWLTNHHSLSLGYTNHQIVVSLGLASTNQILQRPLSEDRVIPSMQLVSKRWRSKRSCGRCQKVNLFLQRHGRSKQRQYWHRSQGPPAGFSVTAEQAHQEAATAAASIGVGHNRSHAVGRALTELR